MNPLVLIYHFFLWNLCLSRFSCWVLHLLSIVLFLELFIITTFLEKLVFLLKIAYDLDVVNLLGSLILDLLLSHFLDLQHYPIESVLINQTVPQLVSLVKQEVDVQVSQNLFLQSRNKQLLDLFRETFVFLLFFTSLFYN